MKFTVTSTELKTAIASCSKFLSKRPTHQILEYFLVTVKENTVTIAATNLQTFIEIQCDAKVEIEGAIAVEAKMFQEITKTLPKGEIGFEVERDFARIAANGNKYMLKAKPAEDFVEIPEIQGESAQIFTKDFLNGISWTSYAASSDETKQIMTGIRICEQYGSLEFAATDGHRIAVSNFPSVHLQNLVVIPASVLETFQKIVKKSKEEFIELTIDSGMCSLECGNVSIKTRTLEGQYPKYDNLFPLSFQKEMRCDRASLVETLKRLSPYVKKVNSSPVNFIIEKDSLTVFVEYGEEKISETLSAELVYGEPSAIRFQIFYLIECLENLPCEQVSFHINTDASPVTLTTPVANVKTLLAPLQPQRD